MEELKEYMIKFEKIKQIINSFKNDRCPICSEKLKKYVVEINSPSDHLLHVNPIGKTNYRCSSCSIQFWENQFYEIYFDAVMRVVAE